MTADLKQLAESMPQRCESGEFCHDDALNVARGYLDLLTERDQLRAMNEKLVDDNGHLRRFLDSEKDQTTRMGTRNVEAMAILGGSYPDGVIERAQAKVAEADRLRAALREACDLADEANGDPDACPYNVMIGDRIAELRKLAGEP